MIILSIIIRIPKYTKPDEICCIEGNQNVIKSIWTSQVNKLVNIQVNKLFIKAFENLLLKSNWKNKL